MRARSGALILIALAAAPFSGCSGTATLLRSGSSSSATSVPGPAPAPDYLRLLGTEQAKLAAAERTIPRRARTPAQFSKAISLLATAIGMLASDLEAIHPPASVADAHARIESVVRDYASALGRAARMSVSARGELGAATMLISATSTVSHDFTTTFMQIQSALAR